MGPKNLTTPAHFISNLRPTPRRKKCPRTNEVGPNCHKTLLRTILSSANRDHGRKKQARRQRQPPRKSQGKAQV